MLTPSCPSCEDFWSLGANTMADSCGVMARSTAAMSSLEPGPGFLPDILSQLSSPLCWVALLLTLLHAWPGHLAYIVLTRDTPALCLPNCRATSLVDGIPPFCEEGNWSKSAPGFCLPAGQVHDLGMMPALAV